MPTPSTSAQSRLAASPTRRRALLHGAALLGLPLAGCNFIGVCEDYPPHVDITPLLCVVDAGGTASFVAETHGRTTLSYQWRRDGVNIPGATGPTWELPNVAYSDHGARIELVVSSSEHTSTSGTAHIHLRPGITIQPQSVAATSGQTATFAVQAVGTSDTVLRYRWSRDGTPIEGADAASYTTGPLSVTDDAALYQVLVWQELPGGLWGAAEDQAGRLSAVATLAVTVAP
ncbi:hypothetical protein [Sphaerotilus microaerophilus]|jgi:hypothetical protein|uniref:Ig-like domain-containing protein n=1 Tax=Sphaerotilus microaerophilus TaxID=2914710 RepID=A0ABN6PN81_9BURK|nr:hypothetical protein [Sphaerotilus sp. FB-5]BDI05527.1 hypothetical protein CATMQ487_24970 [Sphaerotilus sp. FB-5]